ncbi:centriolar and ciliogenesis-associated protein HYLS1-like isoform X1 [Biomphalaria glabrata]|uniref:Centriolar and ciliogenesis-associated protein HYLS1-like isoform X1 n=1 Tax=Biomphalaria glabrata TaxID=6526 RepID=A0A9W2ZYD1_BIOGL|nr:centriolar and ciliogenesis-associated protein HYLS1-like isoform X1 [Biomphalaria glabrata]XP_055879903.1 centriolar and ciliogenesis-associated protein HYLS1-like isoform X1 [Biomphalaria glabrata]KAI8784413.1 hydrolethalus syndrome protein 1 isoform X1 [Biomphalaria glabrata]
MEFTDSEIREELARLGYRDVPDGKLTEFKKDLMRLIITERSKSNSLNSSADADGFKAATKQGDFVYDSTKKYDEPAHAGYRENWRYKGHEETSKYSTDYTFDKTGRVPGTYSLYDIPNSSRSENIYGYKYDKSGVVDDGYSETDSEITRQLKRKTSRKTSDGSRVVDESSSSTGVADLYDIYEKVKNLAMRDCECGKSRPTSSATEPPYRIKGVNKNPSVIKVGDAPNPRSSARMAPNKRYHMYRQLWKVQPPIGDDIRRNVRNEVHTRMLQKEDIKVYQKTYIPNSYVVPTEKPRYDLRWQVRKANAMYEMPPHGFYHEV